ncbi:hypothetical protein [Ilumatobacter coccineus]|nr:hypothetical protein [Ilumatobacter coccineus]
MTIDAPNDHHRDLPRVAPVRRLAALRMVTLGLALTAVLATSLFGATSVSATAPDTSVDSAAGTMVFVLSIVAVLFIAAIIVWKAQKNRPR